MSAPTTNVRPPAHFQFRLGTLLSAMFALGIACAALAMPTPFWAGTLLCLAIVSLLSCILLAIHRTGRTRAFAVGFLVFGGGYLASVLLLDHTLRKLDNQAPMPISRVAYWTFFKTHAQKKRAVTVQVANGMPGGGSFTAGTPPAVTTRVVQMNVHNVEDFVEIIHSILSLLLGFLGSIFARFLFTTRREEESE
jgi:hypothetical protein